MSLLAYVRQRYLRAYGKHTAGKCITISADEGRLNKLKLQFLEEIRADTLALLEKVPDDLFHIIPDGEAWSCHDIVNHLAADEDGEFYPGPPDSLMHRIKTDMVHYCQVKRFLYKLSILNRPDEEGIAI